MDDFRYGFDSRLDDFLVVIFAGIRNGAPEMMQLRSLLLTVTWQHRSYQVRKQGESEMVLKKPEKEVLPL
jgi:hypothetical protein